MARLDTCNRHWQDVGQQTHSAGIVPDRNIRLLVAIQIGDGQGEVITKIDIARLAVHAYDGVGPVGPFAPIGIVEYADGSGMIDCRKIGLAVEIEVRDRNLGETPREIDAYARE
ncbi:hypothetical protein D3C86_1884400 [compost metagenome]